MLKLMGKKIFTILRSKLFFFILETFAYVYMVLIFQEENQESLCEELLKKWEQFFGEKTKSEDKSSGELNKLSRDTSL